MLYDYSNAIKGVYLFMRTLLLLLDQSLPMARMIPVLKSLSNMLDDYFFQGMAHFEVAKNPNAPFVIRSAQNQVTVLGTGFDVRSYEKMPLQVTVNHGKVRVEKLANHSNTALESTILTKGIS